MVAAVHASPEQREALGRGEIRDSKTLSNRRVIQLAGALERTMTCQVTALLPEEYNAKYDSLDNLNDMLADVHTDNVASLLEDRVVDYILVDKFANDAVLQTRFDARSIKGKLVQEPRAERDPVVAAASILARARYLEELDAMSAAFGVKFLSGAGAPVLELGRKLVLQQGPEVLDRTAKRHFRTTETILEGLES